MQEANESVILIGAKRLEVRLDGQNPSIL